MNSFASSESVQGFLESSGSILDFSGTRPLLESSASSSDSLFPPSNPAKRPFASEQADELSRFLSIYPTLNTWNFRRSINFWPGVSYAVGSFLFFWAFWFENFVLDSSSDNSNEVSLPVSHESHQNIVFLRYYFCKIPVFLGGMYYGFGVYMEYLQLINVGLNVDFGPEKMRYWRGPSVKALMERGVSWKSVGAIWSYVLGVSFYTLAQVSDLILESDDKRNSSSWVLPYFTSWVNITNPSFTILKMSMKDLLVAYPYVLGGVFFSLGGAFQVLLNREYWRWKNFKFSSPLFWLTFCNFWGGICFLLSSTPGLLEKGLSSLNLLNLDKFFLETLSSLNSSSLNNPNGGENSIFIAACIGGLGDFLYWFSGLCGLLMWRSEQFGGAMLPILNDMNALRETFVEKDYVTGVYRFTESDEQRDVYESTLPDDVVEKKSSKRKPLAAVLRPRLTPRSLLFINIAFLVIVIYWVTACTCLYEFFHVSIVLQKKSTLSFGPFEWHMRKSVEVEKFAELERQQLANTAITALVNLVWAHAFVLYQSAQAQIPSAQPFHTLMLAVRGGGLLLLSNSLLLLKLLLEKLSLIKI